ncbi:MAG: hypothetical protein ABR508_00205 [Candidatus Baltobacteraceae bacterium]
MERNDETQTRSQRMQPETGELDADAVGGRAGDETAELDDEDEDEDEDEEEDEESEGDGSPGLANEADSGTD